MEEWPHDVQYGISLSFLILILFQYVKAAGESVSSYAEEAEDKLHI